MIDTPHAADPARAAFALRAAKPKRYQMSNVVDIRADLTAAISNHGTVGAGILDAALKGIPAALSMIDTDPVIDRAVNPTYVAQVLTQALNSPIFYVTAEMCGVLEQMMNVMPIESVLTADALPDGCVDGLLVLEKPISVPDDAWDLNGTSVTAAAMATGVFLWRPYRSTERDIDDSFIVRTNYGPVNSSGVVFETFTQSLVWTGGSPWKVLDRLDKHYGDGDDLSVATQYDRRLFLALANLCRTKLAKPQRVKPDRAARRRAERVTGQQELAYRRITLRRYWQHSDPAAGPTGEHPGYSKRWVVSGHWRMQACGPRLQHRKPVYIEPHIKGPAWAPLDESEVIRAVCR